MKALILAAGYGTRIQEVAKDTPKALIEIGNKTILDHLFEQLRFMPCLDGFYLVTNHKFYDQFVAWRNTHDVSVEILDDGTSCNEDRLGAIGDLQLLIEKYNIKDDILVCASDTIVQPKLAPFVESFKKQRAPWICVRREENEEDRKHRGIVSLDNEERVTSFEEKPEHPKSDLAAVPFYIYPKEIVPMIREYLDSGGTADAPGHFVAWIYKKQPVYAYNIEGKVMDIGNPESLEKARKVFK
ncbi:MAG: hypothetical protein COW93_01050 [Parcubacteria group bacterium CG22_combo_CG10-13_8_21_14_all_41_9]|nr:MAG: hypothetical protein COW93_01050 [Parcubacteria group bacterium CG22_combo_CG10-13_8_21_14_all_41_9]